MSKKSSYLDQVRILANAGMSNKDIAHRLHISLHDVNLVMTKCRKNGLLTRSKDK